MKTRLVLESEVMQSLASRTPAPDLRAAVELLDSMEDAALSAEEFCYSTHSSTWRSPTRRAIR